MADYIYTMETRLSPEQQRAVVLVQDIARNQSFNLYLTGGTLRNLISGFAIRNLDFTLQGNPLKLQKDLEKAGVRVEGVDDDVNTLYLVMPGNVRAEVTMARTELYDKPGKPPRITPATINEDLRRRDFTINAMALSLNSGSRGLLLDPANGVADLEAKLIRILHNYAFLEDPSRLIRATRFAARFHWPLEERTQARYDAAKENNYIEYITDRAIGLEIGQLAFEEDPLHILRALEKEGWLKLLHAHWSLAKVDTTGLAQLIKARQQMMEFGYSPDPAPAVMYFLTRRLGDKDVADMQKVIPRRLFVETWRRLDNEAGALAKKLTGKESATPSRTWQVLSQASPEAILFLEVTGKNQSAAQKLKNFFGKWRQVKQKLPLPEMTELHITPGLPQYPKIEQDVFYQLLDGKLHSRTELLKYLKPLAPPPPPPPPPPPSKRGKAAKAVAVPVAAGQKLKKGAAPPAPKPALAPKPAPPKPEVPAEKAPEKPVQKAAPVKAAPAKPAGKKPVPKLKKKRR